MSGNVIGTATIQIVPDLSRFTPELKSKIESAVSSSEAFWNAKFEQMENAIRELTNVLKTEMAEIRAVVEGTTTDLATEFNVAGERAETQMKASGEAIENAIRETANTAQVQGERIERAYAEAGRKAHTSMSSSMGMLGGAMRTGGTMLVAVLGAAAVAATKSGIEMTGTFDKAQASFTALTGSVADGKKLLEDVKGFAFKTPFDVKDVADQTRNLLAQGQAYGVTKDNVLQYASAIGDAVALTGGSNIEFGRVTRALGQMGSSSKVMAQDMNQLQQSIPGINVWQALGNGLGVTEAEARKMGEQGLIPGAQAANILVDAMKNMPGAAGEMERQASTVTGALQNFKEQAQAAMTDGMRPFTDALRTFLGSTEAKTAIAQLGAGFGQLLAALAPVFPVITNLASVFGSFLGSVGKAITPFLNVLGPVLSQLLTSLEGPLTVLAETFGMILTAVSPILPVFAQLITIGANLIANVLVAMQPAIEAIGKAFAQMASAVAPVMASMGKQMGPIFTQIATAIAQVVIALVPLLPSLMRMATAMTPVSMKLLPIFADLLVRISDLLVKLLPSLLPIIDAMANLSVMMGNMLASIAGGIASALSWVIGGLAEIASMILTIISDMVGAVLSFLGIASPSKVFLDIGRAIIDGLLNGVRAVVGGVIGFFTALPGRIISAVIGIVSSIAGIGRDIITGLWNGINSMFGWLSGLVGGIPGKIVGFIGNTLKTLYNLGSDLITGLWNGISSLDIVGKVAGIVSSVKSKIGEVISALNPFGGGGGGGKGKLMASVNSSLLVDNGTGIASAIMMSNATASNGDIVFNGPVTFGSDAASSVAELDWMRRTRMGAA